MTPSVIPLDGNASLLLWLEARNAGFFPFGLAPVLWHRTPEVEALDRHLWEAINVTLVRCNARALLSRACNLHGLVTLYVYSVLVPTHKNNL